MKRASESGSVTLETTLAIAVLVPLLFAIIQFGDAFQRWLAQDAAAVQAARYAGQMGGDSPEVRAALHEALLASGIDPARATVAIEPQQVGWREPIRVSISSEFKLSIPMLMSAILPLRSVAIARGELNR